MLQTRAPLDVHPRAIFGKKVRFLRRAGFTPANLYGASIESIPVQVATKDLKDILRTTSRNTPLKVAVKGEAETRTAFVWAVQREPVTGDVLHVDFYHVEAGHRMRAQVPLVLINVDPNLEKLDRRINVMRTLIEVETLPEDLPTQIEVDATSLKEIDDEVKVRDLKISERVQVLTPAEFGIAKIVGIVEEVEEVVPGAVAEAAATEPDEVEKKGKAEEEA
jgi:large subunit ribosomal protein L25